ncbi:type II toxin-antitoxin system VapC family toxin [Deinococcus sp. SM5_A1]|uniref:type II toxin-antitoxin system VapC family toxin n=1 Tax=Deinococcus sp. SM5_A1 TaxID=3379094 RepID=UPI00385E9539
MSQTPSVAAPLFLDTSALLRAYLVKDPFFAVVQRAILDAPSVVVSGLAHPEFTAALMQRQHRDHSGRLSAAQVTRLLADFQRDWETFEVVSVDDGALQDASALVIRRAALGLRAMDAVHLVGAQVASLAFDGIEFLTFDDRQRQAAEAEGVPLYAPPVVEP